MNSSLIISQRKKYKNDFYLITKKKRLVVSDELPKNPLLKSNKIDKNLNQKYYRINGNHTNYKNGIIIKKAIVKKRNMSIELDNKNKNYNCSIFDNLKNKSDKIKTKDKGKNKMSNQEYFPISHYITRRFDNSKNIQSVKRKQNKTKNNNSCLNNKSFEPKINHTNSKNVKNAILKTVINPKSKIDIKKEENSKFDTTKASNTISLRKNKFKYLKEIIKVNCKTNDNNKNNNKNKNALFLIRKPAASSCDKRDIETNTKENTITDNYNFSNFNQETRYLSNNETYSLHISEFQKNDSLNHSRRISNSRKQKSKRFNFRHLVYKTELNLNSEKKEKNKEFSKTKFNSSQERDERNKSKKNKNQTNLSPINVYRKKFTFNKNEIIDIINRNNRVIITKKYVSPNKKKDSSVSMHKNECNIENCHKKMIEDKSEYFDFIPKNLIMICDKSQQMNIIIKPRKNLELKLFKHIKRNSIL